MLSKVEFIRVKLAKDEKTNQFVAVKMLHNSFSELELSLLSNEVRALLRLAEPGNPHTLKVMDFNFYGEVRLNNGSVRKTSYFIMPVEDHGEFYNIIEKTYAFPEDIAKVVFKNILESMTRLT